MSELRRKRDIPRASGPNARRINKRHIYRDTPTLPLITFCGLTKGRVLIPSTPAITFAPLTVEEAKDPKFKSLTDNLCKTCAKGAGLDADQPR